ncbi:ABC transporter permease [Polymorphum gilvum]|uniref:ABC transporter, permease protein, putative n=1 Tax=Polymorphum gilvum (strain LMG 25793 / CGMCC 1.9160 / SL003B-26A1) TaxID=991905 RepID=F2J5Y9_POLGS|nr:ABC transporter permease [Polymorphum gilvum]ADZ71243.1 ABC transporter, permease protein, putative [Polymorphum gilvum SL003B-26A1]
MTGAATQMPPPAKPRRWTAGRITGHVLVALWAVAGGVLLLYLGQNVASPFVQRYWPNYVSGFWVTIQLVVLSIAAGALLSVPIALARSMRNPVVRGLAFAYVYFFRGTPLLAQTFLIYYGAGSFRDGLEAAGLWWFFRDAWYCILFAFTLNTSAYQAEILRGAVENVPRGQWEGAMALGLPRPVIFFRIILPQALIVALRPYGNEIILMIKGSAIASIVTIFDLMGETRRAFSRSLDFQAYIWAAVLYLIIVETLRRVWDRLEARLTRHLAR